ncbi:MAG: protein jag [Endomicrobia bacterium]|nr:protein jag [Endomicrobiia bacterium]
MSEIEMTGKNVEEAIKKGLEKLGCTKEQVQIKVLDEGTTGLFGLMGAKPARVLIAGNAKAVEADPKEACKKTEKILSGIAAKMGIGIKNIKSNFGTDSVNVEIEAEDSGFIIGKNGQTLDALEHIAQIMVSNDLNAKIKVNLDCENYRKKQNDKLKVLADKAVEYVSRTGKIYRFDPMNAKERKIIHTYLKDNPKIETFSEGEGAMRKVAIKPSKKIA